MIEHVKTIADRVWSEIVDNYKKQNKFVKDQNKVLTDEDPQNKILDTSSSKAVKNEHNRTRQI